MAETETLGQHTGAQNYLCFTNRSYTFPTLCGEGVFFVCLFFFTILYVLCAEVKETRPMAWRHCQRIGYHPNCARWWVRNQHDLTIYLFTCYRLDLTFSWWVRNTRAKKQNSPTWNTQISITDRIIYHKLSFENVKVSQRRSFNQ